MTKKMSFSTLATLFSILFLIAAGTLYWYMTRSVRVNADLTETEFQKAKKFGVGATDDTRTANDLGRLLYINHCAECHGSDGQGGPGKPGPTLVRSEWVFDRDNVRYIIAKIEQGNPQAGMPAFGGRLRDDDIARIVSVIEQLNRTARSGVSK